MELTPENAILIKPGQVITLTYPGGHVETGVVYGNDQLGLKCNRKDGSYFGLGLALFTGKIKFDFVTDHSPVALYGNRYDFVSNHTSDQ